MSKIKIRNQKELFQNMQTFGFCDLTSKTDYKKFFESLQPNGLSNFEEAYACGISQILNFHQKVIEIAE